MWRKFLALAVILYSSTQSQAQSVFLVEAPLPKSCFRNDLTMELTGKVAVQQEGKAITLNQKASARHEFLERILEAKDGLAEKSARIYEAAEATIAIDSDTVKRSFRPDRRLILAQRGREQLLVYCPWGPFTQEEKELTEHFDTLALPGLLPGKEIPVGAGWSIPTNVTLALCDLEGVEPVALQVNSQRFKDKTASANVEGIVKGIAMAAQVTMEIKARFAFDVKEKRIIAVEWHQHEERKPGPINPAITADVTYKLTRIAVIEPDELGDIALVRALSTPVDKASNLVYRDPKGRFEFQYGRNWHLVGHEDKHVVLRLLSERGDFIAQATLTPYTRETPGKMMEIDDFARLMAEAPGWEQDEQLLEKNASVDVAAERSLKVFRVGAAGKLGGVQAIQYFHLVTGMAGDQMIITFTMDPKQAANLSPHDLALIRSIAFPQVEAVVSERK